MVSSNPTDAFMHEARFRDVATTAVDAVFRRPSLDDYLAFVRTSASPIPQILAGLGDDAAQAARDDIQAQLLEAMLFHQAGVGWQHVTYSGGPPAVTDLLGGQIAALVLPEGQLRQHDASRRIRVLATFGPTRSAYLPDVPSFAEQGHPTLVVKEWFAFFAPGRTPKYIVAILSAELQEAIARPGVLAALAQAGMTAAGSSPPTPATRIADEQRYWQPVLRAHGIRGE
jgi:tripartite-type tricarboxylate transporter receptor subunit TctC